MQARRATSAIELVLTDDAERWAAACRRSGQPVTPFHSHPWLSCAAGLTKSTFRPYVVRAGGADVGVVPWLSRTRSALVNTVNWLPFPYVGPLVPAEYLLPTVQQLRKLALPRRAVVQELQLPPGATYADGDLARSGFRVRRDSTYLIDTTRSEEELWSALAGSFRNKIRQAQRKGVEITTTDQGQDALAQVVDAIFTPRGISSGYFEPAFPPSFSELNRDGLEAHWTVATQEGALIGSQIAMLYEGRAVGWVGGVMPEHRSTHANVAMYWDAISWAREVGASSLDLVGIPDGGIDRFKSQFGGTLHDYPVLTWMLPGLRQALDYSKSRNALKPPQS